jgi:hypothetical protein
VGASDSERQSIEEYVVDICASLLVITMLIVGCRGIGVLGSRRLLHLFHLRGGFRQVAFVAAGEGCGAH